MPLSLLGKRKLMSRPQNSTFSVFFILSPKAEAYFSNIVEK